MKLKTFITLAVGVVNSLWLAHVFVVLYLQGYYPITEGVKWIAFIELVICLGLAGLGVERILRLREYR